MFMGFVRLFVVIGIPLIIIYMIYRKFHPQDDSKKDFQNKSNESSASSQKKKEFKNMTTFYEHMGYAVTQFKVAGVTFQDGRYTRQASLRKLKYNDEPMIEPIVFQFDEYEYEGEPAVLISANGRILGNVPADYVEEFLYIKHNCELEKVEYKVSGGGDYPFGCKMWVSWRMENE